MKNKVINKGYSNLVFLSDFWSKSLTERWLRLESTQLSVRNSLTLENE